MNKIKMPWIGRFACWLYKVRCSHLRDLPYSAQERLLQDSLDLVKIENKALNQEIQECKSILKLRELELKNALQIIERDRLRNEAESKIAANSIALAQLTKAK